MFQGEIGQRASRTSKSQITSLLVPQIGTLVQIFMEGNQKGTWLPGHRMARQDGAKGYGLLLVCMPRLDATEIPEHLLYAGSMLAIL